MRCLHSLGARMQQLLQWVQHHMCMMAHLHDETHDQTMHAAGQLRRKSSILKSKSNFTHLLVKHAARHQLAVVDGAAHLAHHADVAQVQPARMCCRSQCKKT